MLLLAYSFPYEESLEYILDADVRPELHLCHDKSHDCIILSICFSIRQYANAAAQGTDDHIARR